MKFLIIGGSSVSGQAMIRGIREKYPQSLIISTTSGNGEVSGADQTLKGIELDQAGADEKIRKELPGVKIDFLVYVPARGMVGIPASAATAEMVNESLDYCLRPALRLAKTLKPQKTVMLSGFITMEPLLEVYGAMTFTKIAMETLAVEFPEKLQMIRLGMFHSNSVRGIALLVQRNMTKERPAEYENLYRDWKASGKRFQDFFYEKNYRFEENNYRQHGNGRPFRGTEPDDIRLAIQTALASSEPIINVLGSWVWKETEMVPLPPVIRDNIGLIPFDELRSLLR